MTQLPSQATQPSHPTVIPSRLLGLLLATALCRGVAMGQGEHMPASQVVEGRLEAASMVDRMGAQVDASLAFVDERAYPYALKQLFPGSRPVVLLLGYYHCPRMCGQVMEAAFRALSEVALEPGQDYQIVSVSIDPSETPAMAKERKDAFLPKLAKVGADDGWRVLTGQDGPIRALAEQVGFRYFRSEHSSEYAHPPALVFLTPQGVVSRSIVNTEFEPADLRLAIVEASQGKLGTMWDQVQLNCLTFDNRTNTYSLQAMTVMRIGGVVTLVALGGMILYMLRRERRATQPALA